MIALAVSLWLAFGSASALAENAAQPDRSTPRSAVLALLDAANRQDEQALADALGLPPGAAPAKRARSAELARELAVVLDKSASFELDDVSDDPNGKPEDGANVERIATFRDKDRTIAVTLERSKLARDTWIVSQGTQAHIPELYARYLPSPLEQRVPAELKQELLGLPYWQWLGVLAAVVLAIAVAGAAGYLIQGAARRVAAQTRVQWDDELVEALHAPARLFLSVLVYVPLAHSLSLPGDARLVSIHVSLTLAVAALAWSLVRIVGVVSNAVERSALVRAAIEDRRSIRVARTQVRVLRRVLNVLICACAGALFMLQFEVVRNVGVSLLASAGVAGVVLGFAAQRTLGSIFAGIQLSITQPISIGDDVKIENEYGTIEEITLTYVVVLLWDERRLIVPITRFLEQPFQNSTKVSPNLHGTVMLQADFALPVDALRAELDRLLAGHPLWDSRTQAVHVTDAHERTLEIRVLVSAEDGGKLFELRAELREKLAAWLTHYEDGRYLPTLRLAQSERAR